MCNRVGKHFDSISNTRGASLYAKPIALRCGAICVQRAARRADLLLVQACTQSDNLCSRRQVLRHSAALCLISGLPTAVAPSALGNTAWQGQHSSHLAQEAFCLAANRETDTVARQYDGYAAGYDQLDTGAAAEAFGVPELRQSLLSRAFGQVLEVAIGTGINLPLYNRQYVQSLTGLDLSPGMLQQARSKASSTGAGDVEALPFEEDSFDCVVDTFSLCVFPKPLLALQQMARVLRPDGKLLLLEHSRSNFPPLGLYQDISAGAVAALGKGCVWNQDVKSLLRQAGFRPTHLQTRLGGLITWVEAEKI